MIIRFKGVIDDDFEPDKHAHTFQIFSVAKPWLVFL